MLRRVRRSDSRIKPIATWDTSCMLKENQPGRFSDEFDNEFAVGTEDGNRWV